MNSTLIMRFARPALALGFVAVSTAACVVEPAPVHGRPVVYERPAVVVDRPPPPREVVVERPAPGGFCYYHPYAPACH